MLNLDSIFEKASVEIQNKLLGSYFKENLVFDGKKFRILPFDDTIMLICRYNKGFQSLKKETLGKNQINSSIVPGVGLEPTRPSLVTGF